VPWKGKSPVDLRMEFIARLNKGERVKDLCHEFGVSRKTGHKLKKRYEELGITGLVDQSRAPKSIPHRTPPEVVELIIARRREHPTWGPRKLKQILEEELGRRLPCPSTIGGILFRNSLTERRPRRRERHVHSSTSHLTEASAPNEVWCVDYKGQFRLGDKSYCFPLTITDSFSRFILCCDGMAAISEDQAVDSFEMIFRNYGLPEVVRSDNGVPFASNGLAALSKLSAYWLRLEIAPERIRPGKPQENGQHERMHRTLKRETTRPPRTNLLQQQERFDDWVEEFNDRRPHEALEMKRPTDVYRPSERRHPDVLPVPEYPLHDDVRTVTSSGSITLYQRRIVYLTKALVGQQVGIREEDDGRWLVTFAKLDLGHVERDNTLTPVPNLAGQ
jgi:transposase InsO family protein